MVIARGLLEWEQPRWWREHHTAEPNDSRQPQGSQSAKGPPSSPDGWPRCTRCASWFRKPKLLDFT